MLGEDYTLEYLPLFDEELSEAVRYISVELRNPDAAARLVDDVERAITDRLFAPESFEPVQTGKDLLRLHTVRKSACRTRYLSVLRQ